jgi:hypothetical protein
MPTKKLKPKKRDLEQLDRLFHKVAGGELFFYELNEKMKGKASPITINKLFKEWYEQKKQTEIKDEIKRSKNKKH